MVREFEQLIADNQDRPFATVAGLVPGVEKYSIHKGKVRDTIDLGDGTLLMVATGRLS